jgi:hypothetical protein
MDIKVSGQPDDTSSRYTDEAEGVRIHLTRESGLALAHFGAKTRPRSLERDGDGNAPNIAR